MLLIPSGLAQAGIANVTRNLTRDKHSFGLSDYFDTIKANWKQSLIVGILNLLVTVLLCFGLLFYYNSEGIFSDIALGFLLICFVIFSFMRYYMWTMIITFDLPVSKIYKNSFLLAFVNFKSNLFVGVIELALYAAVILTVVWIPHFIVLFLGTILAVFILPGFTNLLIQFNTFPTIQKYMIDPYYEAHPDEDISLRRSLSLDIKEHTEEDQEPIFHD
jgi:uncharacterized membrane protein YesL